MKVFRVFNPRILSFMDIGLILISAPVYARTVQGVHSSIPEGINFMIVSGSLLPFVLLSVISLLCLKGGRRAYIAAMILSSLMSVIAILLAGGGGFILIFLDGVEAGINASYDAVYCLSLFMIGGGFLLAGYMVFHIISIFRSAERFPQ